MCILLKGWLVLLLRGSLLCTHENGGCMSHAHTSTARLPWAVGWESRPKKESQGHGEHLV